MSPILILALGLQDTLLPTHILLSHQQSQPHYSCLWNARTDGAVPRCVPVSPGHTPLYLWPLSLWPRLLALSISYVSHSRLQRQSSADNFSSLYQTPFLKAPNPYLSSLKFGSPMTLLLRSYSTVIGCGCFFHTLSASRPRNEVGACLFVVLMTAPRPLCLHFVTLPLFLGNL